MFTFFALAIISLPVWLFIIGAVMESVEEKRLWEERIGKPIRPIKVHKVELKTRKF